MGLLTIRAYLSTSLAGPSHMIYIVPKGQAKILGHLQQLPYLSFWIWAETRQILASKGWAGSSYPPISSCPCWQGLRIRGLSHLWQFAALQAQHAYPDLLALVACTGVLAPQFFLLHFILPCRRHLSGCHLLPDTCWNETCCSSTDPVCLEYRFNLVSRLQGT